MMKDMILVALRDHRRWLDADVFEYDEQARDEINAAIDAVNEL